MLSTGQIQISVSDDDMIASLTLRSSPSGQGPTIEQVQELLSIEGITHGIDWAAIRGGLYTCTTSGQPVRDLIIAKGRPPRDEIPEGFLFSPHFRHLDPVFQQILPPDRKKPRDPEKTQGDDSGPVDPLDQGDQVNQVEQDTKEKDFFHSVAGHVDEHGQIDYKERNTIPLVHAGQVLAVRSPKRPGEMGTSVRGEMIPYETKSLTQLEPGKNTRNEDGRILSEVDGRFVWDKQQFGVDTTLELTDDIGYKTGNIRFPGDLVLKGGVQDRFTLWVGGDLIAEKTLNVYDIFVGKDLEAREGLIGRNGRLRVRGNAVVKFVEHCNLDVLGELQINGGVMSSVISVRGGIQGAEHGKVIGGRLIAGDSVELHAVGNAMGVATRLILGVDFVKVRTLENYRTAIQKLGIERLSLSKKLKTMRTRKLQDYYQQLAEKEILLNQKLGELLTEMGENEAASLIVHGTLHPGVEISIGTQSYQVDSPQSRCRVSLDPSQGVISVGKI